jgi:NhaA family Na+:H+ antiporter
MGKRKKVMNLMQEFSLPLILGVIISLIWANLGHHSYHEFLHYNILGLKYFNFHFIFNDIFMVFFFGIAAVEITQSVLPGGDLNPMSKAVNPLMATAGGVLGPIGAFFLLNAMMGNPSYHNGWGIPTATDIALAWLVARMVFGAKHPAVSFLLLLAIADDAIGLVIIAIFYPTPGQPVLPIFLGITAVGMLISFILRKKGIKSFWPYLIFGGTVAWVGLFKAGIHPALALVFIVPFMPSAPTAKGGEGHLMEEIEGEHNTISNFEHAFKLFVDIGLLGFGLSNSGVLIGKIENLTIIILLALLIGKTLGVFIFSNISSIIFKAPLPEGMKQRDLLVAGVIAALGLTVALFVSGQAFPPGALQSAAKMGALLSVLGGVIAIILGKILKIEKKN